ncbi:MAG: rod shape-determining protein MreD [Desulfobacterales bacterium]|nr:rod shape-determining protein MreD [Desulfobacterales bacterium]
MYKALGLFAMGMLWLIVATTLVGFLPPWLPAPDVVLIVVILFSFQYPLPLGGGLSFLFGLMQDVLSGGVIGLNALSKTVVFSLSRWIRKRFYFSTVASKIAMVFLGGMVDGLLVIVILLIGGMLHTPVVVLARQLLLQVLFTGLLSPLVLVITPTVSDLGERGAEDGFSYGHKKARARGI